jgi:hypothetical protein
MKEKIKFLVKIKPTAVLHLFTANKLTTGKRVVLNTSDRQQAIQP